MSEKQATPETTIDPTSLSWFLQLENPSQVPPRELQENILGVKLKPVFYRALLRNILTLTGNSIPLATRERHLHKRSIWVWTAICPSCPGVAQNEYSPVLHGVKLNTMRWIGEGLTLICPLTGVFVL